MCAKQFTKFEEDQLSELFLNYWKYISEASFDARSFCESLSTSDFIKFISLRNHKSRGSDVENRLMIKNGWSRIKRSAEAGDLMDAAGKRVEVKSSIVTPNKGSRVTLRGFRKWEVVDYYLAVVVDVSSFHKDPTAHIYKLAPDLILAENGFTPDNQSKKARIGNRNVSVGISFDIGDETFSDWEKYRVDLVRF